MGGSSQWSQTEEPSDWPMVDEQRKEGVLIGYMVNEAQRCYLALQFLMVMLR
jgi:hypothetical protein